MTETDKSFEQSYRNLNGGVIENPEVAKYLQEKEQEERFNPIEALKKASVDLSEEIKEPPVALVLHQNNTMTIGTLGNFSCLIGKAKSRKSFTIAIATAAALGNGIVLGFESCMPTDKNNVLYFDTEQARFHVQKAGQRVATLSGYDEGAQPSNLHIYCCRGYDPKQIVEMVEYALYHTENVGFVVIDGIRDLIHDINDQKEATYINTKLLKWTQELNVHIMTVLHQNKGDGFARGHVGTEIVNKAETTISITKQEDDPEVSVVKPEFMRDMEFAPIAFRIDENGIPEIDENYKVKEQKDLSKQPHLQNRSFTPDQIDDETHYDLARQMYSQETMQTYNDSIVNLKKIYGVYKKIGDNKAKEFFKHLCQIDIVTKKGTFWTVNEGWIDERLFNQSN
jgi:hypothetical protein